MSGSTRCSRGGRRVFSGHAWALLAAFGSIRQAAQREGDKQLCRERRGTRVHAWRSCQHLPAGPRTQARQEDGRPPSCRKQGIRKDKAQLARHKLQMHRFVNTAEVTLRSSQTSQTLPTHTPFALHGTEIAPHMLLLIVGKLPLRGFHHPQLSPRPAGGDHKNLQTSKKLNPHIVCVVPAGRPLLRLPLLIAIITVYLLLECLLDCGLFYCRTPGRTF